MADFVAQYPVVGGGGGGSGVTTVGTFSGSSQTNGASISSTTITFGPADATNPGMLKPSGTQTLGVSLTLPRLSVNSAGTASAPAIGYDDGGGTYSGFLFPSGGRIEARVNSTSGETTLFLTNSVLSVHGARISTDLDGVNGNGVFTQGVASGSVSLHSDPNGNLANAARVTCYGHTHATKADVIEFYNNGTLSGSISAGGILTWAQQERLPAGSAGTPSLTFGDISENIGWYRIANNGIAMGVGGNVKAYFRDDFNYMQNTIFLDSGSNGTSAFSGNGQTQSAALYGEDSTTRGGFVKVGGRSAPQGEIAEIGTANVTAITVSSGQAVTIGPASTTHTHALNTATSAPDAGIGTLTNMPTGVSGDPDGYIKITVNGTDVVIPFWNA